VVVGGYRLGDVRHVVASPERAAAVLGFRAHTTFADGMSAFAHDPLRAPSSAPATDGPDHETEAR
jgi:dTDP-L-rhamnose 4-epimerase